MGVPHPVRYSMGLAHPLVHHRHASAGEPVVPGPTEQACRGRALGQAVVEARRQGQPRQHRSHDGEHTLAGRIWACSDPFQVRTNQFEIDNHVGSSFLDCFKGVDLRRTEIVCLAWPAQILAGSSFANQPTYFFQQAGLSSDASFSLGLGVTALAFVGTCISWFVMTVSLLSTTSLETRDSHVRHLVDDRFSSQVLRSSPSCKPPTATSRGEKGY